MVRFPPASAIIDAKQTLKSRYDQEKVRVGSDLVGGPCAPRRRIGQATCLVIVGLEWVKKTGNSFAHAITIPCGAFVWLVVGDFESVGLEGLLAKDCQGAVIRIVNVVKKHANGPAQRGDLRLQVDDSVGGFFVHAAVIRAKLRRGQSSSNVRFPPGSDRTDPFADVR